MFETAVSKADFFKGTRYLSATAALSMLALTMARRPFAYCNLVVASRTKEILSSYSYLPMDMEPKPFKDPSLLS